MRCKHEWYVKLLGSVYKEKEPIFLLSLPYPASCCLEIELYQLELWQPFWVMKYKPLTADGRMTRWKKSMTKWNTVPSLGFIFLIYKREKKEVST